MKGRWVLAPVLALLACAAFSGLSGAEIVQKGDIRVKFDGTLMPKALPRDGLIPVQVGVGARITALDESDPPKLRKISIAINSAGKFSPSALPVCTVPDIQPSTTENALKACGSSLVGTGTFAAKILLPQQASFSAGGKLYAFNGRYQGHPAILAHVFGTDPVPTSFTLPFVIATRDQGQLGTVLTASLGAATGKAGYITELSLVLGATKGRAKAYLGASCPAPKGFGGATFPFAKATLDFGGSRIDSVLTRNCRVRE